MITKILNFLKGKKTFIVGICAIIYGFYVKDPSTIIIGSGFIGLRQGLLSLEQQIVPIVLAYFQNSQAVKSAPYPATAAPVASAAPSAPLNDPASL